MLICNFMKGYLFISNTAKPSKEEWLSKTPLPIGNFENCSLYAAKQMGFRLFRGISRKYPEMIMCASPDYEITYYDQHTYRSIFAIKDNWLAYKNACNLLRKYPEIEVIHCNTPIGGVIGRLVGKKFNKKVIYMVHGFHFYKGAPLINWLFFYPVEKFLLRYTDVLITINTEDYNRAKNFKLKNSGNVYYVPGVGIDLDKISKVSLSRDAKRKELGLPINDILVIAVGRLDKNKNLALVIDAIGKMRNTNVHLIVCGEGEQRNKLENQVLNLGLSKRIHLLGNRKDVVDLYNASDIFVLSSFREGLSRSIMEAMGAGLPCIVTKIRGNTDLIEDAKGGFCIDPHDSDVFAKYLDLLVEDEHLRSEFSKFNKQKIKAFSDTVVKEKMTEIFKKEL